MHPFTYNALPARVLFGWGTSSQVAAEVKRLGCSRALVLTTPQQVDAGNKVKADLGDLAAGIYTNATMHTPMDVTQDALAKAKELQVDCCVRALVWPPLPSPALALCPVSSVPCTSSQELQTDMTPRLLSQVSVGGGSTIGLGKALALHSPDDAKIKNLVIPTTCASLCSRDVSA